MVLAFGVGVVATVAGSGLRSPKAMTSGPVDRTDASALAAHYGSVSAVTSAVAPTVVEGAGVGVEGLAGAARHARGSGQHGGPVSSS